MKYTSPFVPKNMQKIWLHSRWTCDCDAFDEAMGCLHIHHAKRADSRYLQYNVQDSPTTEVTFFRCSCCEEDYVETKDDDGRLEKVVQRVCTFCKMKANN